MRETEPHVPLNNYDSQPDYQLAAEHLENALFKLFERPGTNDWNNDRAKASRQTLELVPREGARYVWNKVCIIDPPDTYGELASPFRIIQLCKEFPTKDFIEELDLYFLEDQYLFIRRAYQINAITGRISMTLVSPAEQEVSAEDIANMANMLADYRVRPVDGIDQVLETN